MQNPADIDDSRGDDTCYQAWLLSNGRFSTLLSANGGGFCALDGFALTRWVPDPTRDVDGVHIYLRDVESGTFRTAAAGPAAGSSGSTFRCDGGIAQFHDEGEGLECTTRVCVPPDLDVELRHLALRNTGTVPRTFEVTTYAELALNTPAADAAHPAFSKLFVQTAHDPSRDALLAWRRARSPDDRPLWAAHRLLVDSSEDPAQYETDRARFIGRGRDLHDPAALACGGQLSGTVGNVLDPVFSMRRVITLEPGAATAVISVLAGAASRDLVLHTIDQLPHVAAAAASFVTCTPPPSDGLAALGLPRRWREQLLVHGEQTRLLRIPPPDDAVVPRMATADDPVAADATGDDAGVDHAPGHSTAGHVAAAADPVQASDLRFHNGWGGFQQDGTAYVIHMPAQDGVPRRPPLPWVNVMANEEAGCIVSESGAMYTWAANSRENRITPWFNDPVSDPHGEALFIRDDETGAVWSPTAGPAPAGGDYEVRHGFGSTRFLHESGGIAHDTCIFVPADAPARIARVRLTNLGSRPRRLTLYGYAQLVLGAHEADTRGRVTTWRSAAVDALMARNDERGEFSGRIAFAAITVAGASGAAGAAGAKGGNATAGTAVGGTAEEESACTGSWTTDRKAFLGAHGHMAAPAGVRADPLDGWTGAGRDPCFALSRALALEAGATATFSFLLGEASDENAAAAVVRRFARTDEIDAALAAVGEQWRHRVGAVHIETPSPAIDVMVNGWLVYQNLSCRMWARSAYQQSGGAFGFRDQLQDSSALVYVDPAITRRQILLHAAHQFVEGDVLHWWHPPLGKGIRTRFSDDLLWLPYITAFYVSHTGDRDILDETIRYLHAEPLEPGEDEAFVVPEDSGTSGTLYEHCCRALDRSLTSGAHGLPLMGAGDWNDGMNRVGREGRGESVWLGFFIYDILRDFMPLCAARGDDDRVAAYSAYQEHLAIALNDAGWDGEWYRRAYYDDGAPLGSAQSDECRIDALAQAWAVMSGAAPPERAAQALDAMEHHLVDEDAGLIRLLAPPFDRTPNDPGYIRGYLPGVRENGGQYTHGVLWAVRALAANGRTERAARLLEMLSPATRGGTPAAAARYMVEPYVIAADVYGVAPHVGRGGWTWYTGSAGWMFRIALESVLGVDLHEGRELLLTPCIPDDWPGFRVTLRLPEGTVYRIDVSRGERQITLDGAARDSGAQLSVPLLRDGGEHHVQARIPAGAAAARDS